MSHCFSGKPLSSHPAPVQGLYFVLQERCGRGSCESCVTTHRPHAGQRSEKEPGGAGMRDNRHITCWNLTWGKASWSLRVQISFSLIGENFYSIVCQNSHNFWFLIFFIVKNWLSLGQRTNLPMILGIQSKMGSLDHLWDELFSLLFSFFAHQMDCTQCTRKSKPRYRKP